MTVVSTICEQCGQRVEVDSARWALIQEFGDDVECRDHTRAAR